MKPYELTYIISSEITTEQAETEAKNIESFIQDKEGVILKSENPSPKTLAYPIKKQGSGFFAVLEFQLEPKELGKLKEKLQKNDKIIRHMLIIKNPEKIQKERRIRKKPLVSSPLVEAIKEEKTNKKVELREIEEKLEEILSE